MNREVVKELIQKDFTLHSTVSELRALLLDGPRRNAMADERDLISLRNRELKLRLLDRNKMLSERTKWQLINVAVPSVVVVLFGVLFIYFRRRKYAKR